MNNFDDFINKNPGVVSSEMTFDGNRPFDFNSEKDVEEFAKQMVSGNNKLDPFWDNMSENLLKSIIYYVLASREKKNRHYYIV